MVKEKEVKLQHATNLRKKEEKVPTIQELGKALLTKHDIHYNLEKQRVTIIDNDYKHTNVHVQEGDTFSLENGIAIAIVKHFFGYDVVKELAKRAKRTDKANGRSRIDDIADVTEWYREIVKTLNEDLDRKTVDRKASFYENLKKVKFTDVDGVKGEQELKVKEANQKKATMFKLWDRVMIYGRKSIKNWHFVVGIEPNGFYLVSDSNGVGCCKYDKVEGGIYAPLKDEIRVRRYSERELDAFGILSPYNYIVLE